MALQKVPENFETLGHRNPQEDAEAIENLLDGELFPMGHKAAAIEVGCWTGLTTIQLADWFDTVYAVDRWRGDLGILGQHANHLRKEFSDKFVFEKFCENMGSDLFTTVIPLHGVSSFWAPTWQKSGRQVDFIYIDADHRYDKVKYDIEAWTPVVRKGGILAGHDYNSFEGVNRAVNESGPFQKIGQTVWWRRIE